MKKLQKYGIYGTLSEKYGTKYGKYGKYGIYGKYGASGRPVVAEMAEFG